MSDASLIFNCGEKNRSHIYYVKNGAAKEVTSHNLRMWSSLQYS